MQSISSDGNALIISEDLDSSDPDDNARGGVITIYFPNYDLSSFGFHLLDIDSGSQNEQVGHIDFFKTGGFIDSYLFSDLIFLDDFGKQDAD
jgi:hypothetical protein